jgi:hypothetical protein
MPLRERMAREDDKSMTLSGSQVTRIRREHVLYQLESEDVECFKY